MTASSCWRDPTMPWRDEPLAALDPVVRAELQGHLGRLFAELGKTVVLVTHDIREAAVFATSITLLTAGRVVQRGTFADLVDRPATQFVTQFLTAQTLAAGAPARPGVSRARRGGRGSRCCWCT